MGDNLKKRCLSCGELNDAGSNYCGNCGSSLATRKGPVNWKWVILSMLALVFFMILILALAYFILYMSAGPHTFMKYIMVIPYAALPLSVFSGAFIFRYLAKSSTPVDLAAGITLFMLVSNVLNLVFIGAFTLSGILWIPVLAALAYAGAWSAVKLKARKVKASA
ncbi:MAG TPA: zinc ribbon domain-containing protein [Spirochaetota bacterium]|nr:zinc ribbon domain-containing protein [Spirochaetota bacterium]